MPCTGLLSEEARPRRAVVTVVTGASP
jgi:hypothetical protein